jgi:phage/plasmid-like protein (TIGR03299 family)
MAHELELINGEAQMFYRGEAPWHKLGRFIEPDEALTTEDAIVAAGLDWNVSTRPLYLDDGTQAPSNAVVRDDTNGILGVVSQKYQPLQNREAFKFFDPFIESGEAMFETAGSLKDGKRIWVLAKINKDPLEIARGDVVDKYILLSNGHDGLVSVRAGFTPIRVVCQNTLSMATSNDASQLIRLKHTKNLQENLDKVAEIMNVANASFEATAEQYRFLANRTVSQADLERYVKLVFVGEKYVEMEKMGLNPAKRILAEVIPLFEKGRGNDMSSIKGTAWAAYNAVNEYLQYERGNDEDSRLDKLWFGDGATLNQRALGIITKLVS